MMVIFPNRTKFPLRFRKWMNNCRREGEPGIKAVLCNKHFTEECMDRTGQTVRLREGAVPTIFNISSPRLQLSQLDAERIKALRIQNIQQYPWTRHKKVPKVNKRNTKKPRKVKATDPSFNYKKNTENSLKDVLARLKLGKLKSTEDLHEDEIVGEPDESPPMENKGNQEESLQVTSTPDLHEDEIIECLTLDELVVPRQRMNRGGSHRKRLRVTPPIEDEIVEHMKPEECVQSDHNYSTSPSQIKRKLTNTEEKLDDITEKLKNTEKKLDEMTVKQKITQYKLNDVTRKSNIFQRRLRELTKKYKNVTERERRSKRALKKQAEELSEKTYINIKLKRKSDSLSDMPWEYFKQDSKDYNTSQKDFANCLYKISPKAYHYLRNAGFPLPAQKTLKGWMKDGEYGPVEAVQTKKQKISPEKDKISPEKNTTDTTIIWMEAGECGPVQAVQTKKNKMSPEKITTDTKIRIRKYLNLE